MTEKIYSECGDNLACVIGVANLADAMREKLKKARLEKNRGGWHKPGECTVHHLRALAMEHIEKGLTGDNVVDIANFLMMIYNHENHVIKETNNGR